MVLTIERKLVVKMDGKAEWKVRQSLLIDVQGESFIKLAATEGGFVKLVCESQFEGSLPKNATLSHSQGLREPTNLRNNKQSEEFRLAAGQGQECALFDAPPEAAAEPAKAKRPKSTWRQVQEARESPEVFEVEVPGTGGQPPKSVRMLRPVNPRDDLCVLADAEMFEHIVLFIRSYGINRDTVEQKRNYKSAGQDTPKGIWKTGKGFVVKLPGVEDGTRKYKRVSSMDAAIGLLEGAEPHMEAIQDASGDGAADRADETSDNASGDDGDDRPAMTDASGEEHVGDGCCAVSGAASSS